MRISQQFFSVCWEGMCKIIYTEIKSLSQFKNWCKTFSKNFWFSVTKVSLFNVYLFKSGVNLVQLAPLLSSLSYIALPCQLFIETIFVRARFYYPLLGRTIDLGADVEQPFDCPSHHPEPSDRAVQGEVDGLDIAGQHVRRSVFVHHTYRPQRGPYRSCASKSGNAWRQCAGGQAGPTLFLEGPFQENGCQCLEWKYGVLQCCPTTPHSISGSPRAPHFCCCCCRMNWWVVVRRVQMGVSFWGVVRSHPVNRWALSGADVQAP